MNVKMKSFLFSAAILIATTIYAWGNTNLKNKDNSSTNVPVITIEEKAFHVGTIVEGDKITHDFQVINKGKQPLNLPKVTTDCSCTTATSDRTILPGESGIITVIFDTEGGSGETFKKVTLYSNDPANPVTVIEIGANILERVTIKPDRIFFRGIKGTPLEKTIAIKAPDNRSFELKLLKSQLSNQIGFYVKKNKNDSSYEVIFRNNAERSESFRGRVFFETNLRERPRITIPVYSKIVNQFQAIPEKINFGNVPPQHPKAMILTIRSYDGKPFEICSIKPAKPIFSTNIIRLKKRGICRIEISPDLSSVKPGKIETSITVNMISPGESSLIIPVTLELN
ncbi:MAG: DUF1573 domain-containing protein [Desulfobacterium sp.]|nr:DUF1573 domain-containing protein [Desulfobacterium sp.]